MVTKMSEIECNEMYSISQRNWSKILFAERLLETQAVNTPLFNEAAKAYAKRRKPKINTTLHFEMQYEPYRPDPQCLYESNCYNYCYTCAYGGHICAGCGDSTSHGIGVCYGCCIEYGLEFLPLKWVESGSWTVADWIKFEPGHFEYSGSNLTRFNSEFTTWNMANYNRPYV